MKIDEDPFENKNIFSTESVMKIAKPKLAELFDINTNKEIEPLEKTRLDLLDQKDENDTEEEVKVPQTPTTPVTN